MLKIFLSESAINETGIIISIIVGILTICAVLIKPLKYYYKNAKFKKLRDSRGDWISDNLHDEHFQDMPVFNGSKNIPSIKMTGSFILHGSAGSGKSMILKNHYLRTKAFNSNALCYFYRSDEISDELVDSQIAKINDTVKNSRYRKVILYFDGLDEAICADPKFFYKFNSLPDTVNVTIRISCRDNFFNQIINTNLQKEQRLFDNDYKTVKWSRKELVKYVISFIDGKSNDGEEIKNTFERISEGDWEKIDNNPLMSNMLFGIINNKRDYKIDENRYKFYESFFYNAVLIDKPSPQSLLSDFARAVFASYSQKTVLNYNDVFERILKRSVSNSEIAIFKHETFKEFLIAYHYVKTVCDDNNNALEVFTCAYPNDIADFTTAGLLLQDEKKINDKLINIYSHTMGARNDDALQNALNSLQPECYFRLKYEIIFRMGRLQYRSVERRRKIIDTLELIYYNDNNIPKIRSDNPSYWTAVLKRCCAIGSSFLGGYKIEMDYVSKMLDWNPQYDSDYDLANRSHTLYFYGDITNENDIFGYVDTAANCSCEKALHKRIDRLSKINDAIDIKNLDSSALRKYYFRLFDIATVYTFIKSRIKHTDLLNLSAADKKIIKDFKADFIDETDKNGDRAKLIAEIKNATVNLLNQIE